MEGWDGTVSLKRCLNRDPCRMSQKAIRGKRLPSTSKSKHEHLGQEHTWRVRSQVKRPAWKEHTWGGNLGRVSSKRHQAGSHWTLVPSTPALALL